MDVYNGASETEEPENILPEALQSDFRECRLPNWTMDVLARNKLLLPPQVKFLHL